MKFFCTSELFSQGRPRPPTQETNPEAGLSRGGLPSLRARPGKQRKGVLREGVGGSVHLGAERAELREEAQGRGRERRGQPGGQGRGAEGRAQRKRTSENFKPGG